MQRKNGLTQPEEPLYQEEKFNAERVGQKTSAGGLNVGDPGKSEHLCSCKDLGVWKNTAPYAPA